MLHAREIFIGMSCRQKLSLEFGRDNAENWLIHLLKLSEKLYIQCTRSGTNLYLFQNLTIIYKSIALLLILALLKVALIVTLNGTFLDWAIYSFS